jgi:hypothetical protein
MNTQQWIDLVRILVWPAALVALAIVFRRPLSRLLVTITQLRFRDLEIDFGRELEKLRSALPDEPDSDTASVQSAPSPGLALASDAAHAQPVAGVLLAWSAIETRLSEVADQEPGGTESAIAGLTGDLRSLVQGLFDLSRAAAGGQTRGGAVDASQANDYIRLAGRALDELNSIA